MRVLPGNTKPTVWKQGSRPEVAFAFLANHGGGYRYSLCPKPKTYGGYLDLTEECFNKLPLEFFGSTQYIVSTGQNSETYVESLLSSLLFTPLPKVK